MIDAILLIKLNLQTVISN